MYSQHILNIPWCLFPGPKPCPISTTWQKTSSWTWELKLGNACPFPKTLASSAHFQKIWNISLFPLTTLILSKFHKFENSPTVASPTWDTYNFWSASQFLECFLNFRSACSFLVDWKCKAWYSCWSSNGSWHSPIEATPCSQECCRR